MPLHSSPHPIELTNIWCATAESLSINKPSLSDYNHPYFQQGSVDDLRYKMHWAIYKQRIQW